MVEPRYGIPWLFEALDGNTSDKAHFQSVIARLSESARGNAGQKLYLVADSALYTQEGLQEIADVYWLTECLILTSWPGRWWLLTVLRI